MAVQCFIVLALLGLSKRRMHVGTVEELSKEILSSSLHPAQVEQRIIFSLCCIALPLRSSRDGAFGSSLRVIMIPEVVAEWSPPPRLPERLFHCHFHHLDSLSQLGFTRVNPMLHGLGATSVTCMFTPLVQAHVKGV